MRFILPLLALSALPVAAQAQPIRRAVVVGANDGGGALEPLRHAESDAARMAQLLTELGDFQAQEITLLTSPSLEEVQDALQSATVRTSEADETLFLFYYSGHADARGLRLGSEVYPYEELKAGVRAVPADVHLGILDACQAGAITRMKGAKGSKGASIDKPFLDVEPDLAAEGEAWIAASQADEEAQESDHIGGSFFTHYLISGLRGAADDGDGRVSLYEAYHYASDRTVARTAGTVGGTQHPAFAFNIQGSGQLALTDVRQATAAIVLPPDEAGTITVLREPERTPVAEVAKMPGQEIRLALPPGTYTVRRRLDGQLREARVGLRDGSEQRLDRWGFVRQELAMAKGEEEKEPSALARLFSREKREEAKKPLYVRMLEGIDLRPADQVEVELEGTSDEETLVKADTDWDPGQLIVEQGDTDGDPEPEIFNWYATDSGKRVLVRKELDTNNDGKIDDITYLGPDQQILREEFDRDFDGIFDWSVVWYEGKKISSELDTSGDGLADRIEHFANGEVASVELDTDHDGRMDMWEQWEAGHAVSMGRDLDGDGVIDVREAL